MITTDDMMLGIAERFNKRRERKPARRSIAPRRVPNMQRSPRERAYIQEMRRMKSELARQKLENQKLNNRVNYWRELARGY